MKACFLKQIPVRMVVFTALLMLSIFAALPAHSAVTPPRLELTNAERQYLQSRGPIIFVSQTSYPPFEFVQKDSSMDGMCIELARWISTEAGFQAKFINMSFELAQKAVLSGKADIITSLFFSEKRAQSFGFSDTIFDVPASIFVKAERPDISRLDDLRGKRIAIQRGDYAKEFLEAKGINFELIPTDSFAEATDAVLSDRADALIGDEQIVLYHLFSNRLTKQAKKVGEPLYIGKNCMATRNADPVLRSILEKCIRHARNSGVIDKISQKWLGTSYQVQEGRFSKFIPYLLPVGAAILFLILSIVLWNIKLRQQVEIRTSELAASELKYRELVENANSIILKWSPEGNITFFNEFGEHFFGFSREEIIGRNVIGTLLPQTESSGRDLVQMFQEICNDPLKYKNNENENVRKNGDRVWISWNNHAVTTADGKLKEILSVGQDITERKRSAEESRKLAEQLYQIQRVESIGRLTGGIAHDFNNLLTPIIGYAEMIAKGLPDDSVAYKRVQHIIHAAARAKSLTQQMLSFGRKQLLNLNNIDLNEVVRSFLDILVRTIPENIEIRLSLMVEPACIHADRTQIEQIVMNLVVNSRDSIATSGVIIIETAMIDLEPRNILTFADLKPGSHVVLTVSDNGIGMEKEVMEHIFEPFYTTKEVGRGVGLGLSTVYGIVKQHNGDIQVSSVPGKGSVFSLYFPFVDHPICELEEKNEGLTTPQSATRKILLVEDEEIVRTLVQELLMDAGYEVIVAETAAQALAIVYDQELNLLLTDVVMPEMNGPDLYGKLLEKHPNLKVLFMSGHTTEVITNQGGLTMQGNFLQKPFSTEDVIKKVETILGAA